MYFKMYLQNFFRQLGNCWFFTLNILMIGRDSSIQLNKTHFHRSSSSVEVLGSCTPDSEPPPSLSSSSSVVRLRQSGSFESVEVLTSPSSVEVLGSSSSEREQRSVSSSEVVVFANQSKSKILALTPFPKKIRHLKFSKLFKQLNYK